MSLNITFSGLTQEAELFTEEFLNEKFNLFKQTIDNPGIGFFHLPNETTLLEDSKKIHQKFNNKKNFVHVGIGGSSLGPEMLVSALSKTKTNFIFINNIDPDQIFDQLEGLNIEESLFYFVSKSGGTAETMAGLSIINSLFEKANISKEEYKNHMVFATDPNKSQLLDLAGELGIDTLSIPSNIGGRFSVLTPVGFLPALFAGIDCEKLLEGARNTAKKILETKPHENELFQMASYLLSLRNKGVSQTVFMPYSSKLRNFSFWFIQLWAESLGKKLDNSGNPVHTGLTPIPGYGATDQHSQMQLFMEGPYDKCLMLLDINNFSHDWPLKNDFSQNSLKSLAPFSLSELMKAEFEGTLKALQEANRPYIRFNIQNNGEIELGSLILFLESLTALMGHYLNIDPFNQPGVEAGKRYALEWLST